MGAYGQRHLWRMLGSLLLMGAALSAAACGDSNVEQAPASDFTQGKPCGDAVEVATSASSEVREQTGIDRYQVRVDSDGYHVQLFDKRGDFLGLVRAQLVLSPQQPGEILVHQWMSTDPEGRVVVARQWSRAQPLSEGRVQLQTLHQLLEPNAQSVRKHAVSWVTLDDEATVVRAALGASGQMLARPEGAFASDAPLEVLETIRAGEAAQPQEVRSWLQARSLDEFSKDQHWMRMQAASNDPTWMRAGDLELRRCRAFDFATSTGQLTGDDHPYSMAGQALCASAQAASSAAGAMSTRAQAACHSGVDRLVEGLKFVGDAHDAISVATITTAILLSTPLLGKTALATTLAAAGIPPAVAVVGVALAVYYGSKWLQNYLEENQDDVMGTLFDVGAAGTRRGPQAANDARAFYKSAGSRGDPHLDTLDGLAYDLHSAGEFVLVRGTDAARPLEIQVRQVPIAGLCAGVAVNAAAVVKVGGDRVAFYAENPEEILLNGARVALRAGVVSLPGGGFIEAIEQGFAVGWPDGSAVQLVAWRFADSPLVDIKVVLASRRQGRVQGLLGNFNGDPSDDLRLADGQVIGDAITWETLHGEFADSWRVGANDSLFDYKAGEDHTTFVIPGFPAAQTRLEDLPQAARNDARAACADAGVSDPVVMEGCVLDIVCTGDAGFARAHADRGPAAAITRLESLHLGDWLHAGDPTQGRWGVSEDGRSVQQHEKSSPTFLISPVDYQNVMIRGSLMTTGSDRGAMGFVFGFKSPMSTGDDPQSEYHYDTFYFHWKQFDDTWWGHEIYREGMMLSHVQAGATYSTVGELFGGFVDKPGKHILATRFGTDYTWEHGQKYNFELVYTRDLIRVRIDGKAALEVHQADSPVEFLPGRFGFYSFSQSNVIYSDVRIISLE